MLPSDPVARLPLLPCPSSASASRVAAWLLGADGAEDATEAAAGGGAAPNDACGASDSGSDADVALLHAELEDEAPGVAAAQPPPQVHVVSVSGGRGAAADEADGYHGAPSFYTAQRRSFEGFMRAPIAVRAAGRSCRRCNGCRGRAGCVLHAAQVPARMLPPPSMAPGAHAALPSAPLPPRCTPHRRTATS